MNPWTLTLHLFGALIWFAGTMTALHVLHGYAASETRGEFGPHAGGVGRIMDLGATMAILTGVLMLTSPAGQGLLKVGSMHAKLTAVLLILGVHGFVRMQLGRFGRGEVKAPPAAVVPITVLLFLSAITLIVVRPF